MKDLVVEYLQSLIDSDPLPAAIRGYSPQAGWVEIEQGSALYEAYCCIKDITAERTLSAFSIKELLNSPVPLRADEVPVGNRLLARICTLDHPNSKEFKAGKAVKSLIEGEVAE